MVGRCATAKSGNVDNSANSSFLWISPALNGELILSVNPTKITCMFEFAAPPGLYRISIRRGPTAARSRSTTTRAPCWTGWPPPTRPGPAAGGLPFAVEDLAPGPELAALLAAHDVSWAADAYDVVEAVAAWERLATWVAAGQAKAQTELAARAEVGPAEAGCRSVTPITNAAVVVAGRCQLTARQAAYQVGALGPADQPGDPAPPGVRPEQAAHHRGG